MAVAELATGSFDKFDSAVVHIREWGVKGVEELSTGRS